VTFHRRVYVGELLYCSTYPVYERDSDGKVERVVRHPQRVGLLIDGVPTHFTIPERVEVTRGR
jgi:calcineurin-like phosphoesterase family protein